MEDATIRAQLDKVAAAAAAGRWSQVLDLSTRFQAACCSQHQQQHHHHQQQQQLAFTTLKLLALMRLRRFGQAGDELAQLGSLPEEALAGEQQGVPFGLLLLHAQLPAFLGNRQLALDLLYQLSAYCQRRCAQHEQQRHEQHQPRQQQRPAPAEGALWEHRLHGVAECLVQQHLAQGQVVAALRLLDRQLARPRLHPARAAALWSLTGQLQLRLNMAAHAHASFSRAQRLAEQLQAAQLPGRGAAAAPELRRLSLHNWAAFKALTGEMRAALDDYRAAAAAAAASGASGAGVAEPLGPLGGQCTGGVDGVAAANSAVALLHLGELTEAISSLEAGLQQHPEALLQECTLFNLGLLFDLAYAPASAKQARHQCATSVLRCCPDDFDLSCIEPR